MRASSNTNPPRTSNNSGIPIKGISNETPLPQKPPTQVPNDSSATSKHLPGQGVQLHPDIASIASDAKDQAEPLIQARSKKPVGPPSPTHSFFTKTREQDNAADPPEGVNTRLDTSGASSATTTFQKKTEDAVTRSTQGSLTAENKLSSAQNLRDPLLKGLALDDINKIDLSAPEHESRLALLLKGRKASTTFTQKPSEPISYQTTYLQGGEQTTGLNQPGVKANINLRGVLTYTIIASKDTPSGSVMFNNMLAEIGKNTSTILSCWRNEEGTVDNFTSYNKNVKMGYPPALAAANTFGGKMAIRSGFTDISVKPQGSHIDVEFSVPKVLIARPTRGMDP
jgi:hypothetical protein